jgi:hypothetical protein
MMPEGIDWHDMTGIPDGSMEFHPHIPDASGVFGREAKPPRKGSGHSHNQGPGPGGRRPNGGDGSGDSNSDAGSTASQQSAEQGKQFPKGDFKTEARYTDNAGTRMYDVETTSRLAEKVEERALELATERTDRENAGKRRADWVEVEIKPEDYSRANNEIQPIFDADAVEAAYQRAEPMRAANEAGIDYEDTDKFIEAGALNVEQVTKDQKKTLDEVLYRVGITGDKAKDYLEMIENGILDEEAIRNMPEVREKPKVVEMSPEDTLLLNLDKREISERQGLSHLEVAEVAAKAVERMQNTALGQALEKYITEQKLDSRQERDGKALKVSWEDAEHALLDQMSEVRDLLAKLERGLEPTEDRDQVEARLLALARVIETSQTKIARIQERVASKIGYSGEMPVDKGGLEKGVNDSELDKSRYEQWMKDLEMGVLSQEALDYFRRTGLMDEIERAFERAYDKNFLARFGETVQRFVGGEGNVGEPMPQLMQDTESLFKDFVENSEHGHEILKIMAKSMKAYEGSVGIVHQAAARSLEQLSAQEVVALLRHRSVARENLVADTHRISNETRRGAAAEAWRIAGHELESSLKTIGAWTVQSEVSVNNLGERERVPYSIKSGQIIDESSNRLGQGIQVIRVAGEWIARLDPLADRAAHVVDHFFMERIRKHILRNGQLDVRHINMGNEHGQANKEFVRRTKKLETKLQSLGDISSRI